MSNVNMWAVIDGVQIKVSRIDFFQTTFGVWVADSATTERFIASINIEQLIVESEQEHIRQLA